MKFLYRSIRRMSKLGEDFWSLVLLLSFGAAGIFIAPWFCPLPPLPNISVSYLYGFSNYAAWFALALLLFALFLFQRHRVRRQGLGRVDSLLRQLLADAPREASARVSGLVLAMFTVLAVLVVITWYRLVPVAWIGEMHYFFVRLQLIAAGSKPYADFPFSYGPAMLYPSVWLSLLSGGTVSLEASHCIALVVHWVLGIMLTAYIINCLGGQVRRTAVFLCVMLPWLTGAPWCLGLGYTPLRFVLAPASLFFVHRMITAAITVPGFKLRRLFAPGLLGFIVPLANFALSPEMGCVVLIALLVYFMFLPRLQWSAALVGGVAALLSLPAVWLCMGKYYLPSLLSTGNGNLNLPIYPTPNILLLLFASGLLLPQFAVISLSSFRHPEKFTPLAAALLALLGLLLPVALGRCDFGHVYFNGFVLLVLGLALGSIFFMQSAWRLACAIYLGVFALGCALSFWGQSRPLVVNVLRDNLGEEPLPFGMDHRSILLKTRDDLHLAYEVMRRLARLDFGPSPQVRPPPFDLGPTGSLASLLARGKAISFGPDLRELLSFDKIGTPAGSSEEIDRFLKISGRYIPEFYINGVDSALQLPRKFHDLALMNVILVPDSFLQESLADLANQVQPEGNARSLSLLLAFPVFLPAPRNAPFDPDLELRNEISRHYVKVSKFRDFYIMRRN